MAAAPVVGAITFTAVSIICPNTSALFPAETSRFPTRRLPKPAGKCTTIIHLLHVEEKNIGLKTIPIAV